MHAQNRPIKVELSSALKAGPFSLCSFHGSISDIFQLSEPFVLYNQGQRTAKSYFRLTG